MFCRWLRLSAQSRKRRSSPLWLEHLENRCLPSTLPLVYSSYLGGNSFDVPTATAADAAGNVYVAGYTESGNFPTTGGALQRSYGGGTDAFVAKFDRLGQLVYSTYLG